ncbi:MAG TPA: hypothetical protein VEA78_07550 [Acidimicrobiales bacterium]|nr:hypothetical protein [Acidimicrobiales bacterium]
MHDDEPLAALRVRPTNVHLLRGFGPFAVGAVLFLLMLVLAPSVAPERVVERAETERTTEPTLATTTTSTITTVAP